MKQVNWSSVRPAGTGSFTKLPAGGYVAVITGVTDNANQEYLEITYDIASGEYTGHFGDDWGKEHPYAHQFRRYYSDKSAGFFRQFLDCVEASNPGKFSIEQFSQTGNEQLLNMKFIGIVVQYEQYTNKYGDDKERMNVEAFYPVNDIMSGNFTVPEPKDSREKIASVSDAGGELANSDIALPWE